MNTQFESISLVSLGNVRGGEKTDVGGEGEGYGVKVGGHYTHEKAEDKRLDCFKQIWAQSKSGEDPDKVTDRQIRACGGPPKAE